jgi:hypothetical protein
MQWLLVLSFVLLGCVCSAFAQDLRAQKDTVLSRAVTVAGGTLDPTEAGKLFPFKWKP